ncbi:hypothetical protein R1flu_023600 [Riccia fluitans]|uniref:Uncharacterized protein n=1 Tax=Riccia fluitans TaxID=41844 RepID=A0ABD1XWI7_9MARC
MQLPNATRAPLDDQFHHAVNNFSRSIVAPLFEIDYQPALGIRRLLLPGPANLRYGLQAVLHGKSLEHEDQRLDAGPHVQVGSISAHPSFRRSFLLPEYSSIDEGSIDFLVCLKV